MNEHDEQIDKALREHMNTVDIPEPNPAARRQAIAGAVAEFEGLQETDAERAGTSSQGWRAWLRPIVGNRTDKRAANVLSNPRVLFGGLSAACAGLIAIAVVTQYQPGGIVPGAGVRPAGSSGNPGEVPVLRESDPSSAEDADVVMSERLEARKEVGRIHSAEQMLENAGSPANVPGAMPAPPAQMGQGDEAGFLALAGDVKASVPVYSDEPVASPPYPADEGRDRFEAFEQNRVRRVAEDPVSTFSVDVDTASYSFVRRQLESGVLPQPDAVRVEELINYFDYAYPLPENRDVPFRPTVAVSDSPWADGRKLLHIGIKGYDLAAGARPRSNLVFLLDVSGSMNSPDKLPLVRQSMELLLSELRPEDTVAIAVYAGAAGTVLEPTPVREKQKIVAALNQLNAGGSTAGAQGLRLAYELAEANFDEDAVNRVILATDGDFNVGLTNDRELQGFVERKRDAGIFLSVLGFGQGNYQDQLMQTLAQNGNGVAAYIDTLSEARKVLVEEASSSLFPIAKDVKIQVEFNPATVAEYRLIGYETRHLNREDFNNDAVDAGDIGAGHTVTAIYEITPVGSTARQVEERRYAREPERPLGRRGITTNGEYAFLKIRYKLPAEDRSRLVEQPIRQGSDALGTLPEALRRELDFATSVAGFAQLLKGGRYTGDFGYDDVIVLAQANKGDDPYGYRTEFVQLARMAKTAAAMRAP